VQQREPRADQAHVVIERKPTDADIVRSQLHGLADGANIRKQIRVRQHNALGIAG
jgi:hypothetical protein